MLIAGVDEAGRGPLAGPVVAAAVILHPGTRILGLNDSKKLSARQREKLFPEIKVKALAVGVGIVSHREVDRLNIFRATMRAMKKAVLALGAQPDQLLIDGKYNKIALAIPQRSIVGGDAKIPSISAASIIAKVTRDRIMVKYDEKFPAYEFARHKGYGTKRHYQKLSKMGPCPIHRRSFRLGVLAAE